MDKQLNRPVFFSQRSIIAALVFLFLANLQSSVYADTLHLKNGRSIEGIIQKEDDQDITLEVNGGAIKFSKSQIASISRSSAQGDSELRLGWAQEKEVQEAKIKEAKEKQEHEPKQATLNKETGQMTVAAILNKKVKVNLILDTGASILALTGKVATSLGVDTAIKPDKPAELIEVILADGSKVKARKIFLESVSVQGSEVTNVEAAILPDQASSLIAQDGLLGMSFLKHFSFKIDQKNDKLILEKLK
jgi:clan AA aspartic protease (TIGR02281 family)